MSARRLRDGTLEVRARRGAERMKLWPNRPSKYLKDLFAEAGVPPSNAPTFRSSGSTGSSSSRARSAWTSRFCDELAHDDTLVRFEFRSEASLLGAPADRLNRRQARFGASRRALRTFFRFCRNKRCLWTFFHYFCRMQKLI